MKIQKFLIILLFCMAGIIAVSYAVGHILSLPHQSDIHQKSLIINLKSVEIVSKLGNTVRGWYIDGEKDKGGILLLHGVKSNRQEMLGRALFLNQSGYAVLMIDFQAHGESIGEQITFGYRESYDVETAYQYLVRRLTNKSIGVIGVSLGGASTLLSSVVGELDALVLEAVYPTIKEAISNRLEIKLGDLGRILTPLLTWQIKPRLGISSDWLRPIEKIDRVRAPILILAGSEDRHTLLSESERLYDRAPEPKELWIIKGAAHENFYKYTPEEYEDKILKFFNEVLR